MDMGQVRLWTDFFILYSSSSLGNPGIAELGTYGGSGFFPAPQKREILPVISSNVP